MTRQASRSHNLTTNGHLRSADTFDEDDDEAFLLENNLLEQTVEESLRDQGSTIGPADAVESPNKTVHTTIDAQGSQDLNSRKRNIVDLTESASPLASTRPVKVNIQGRAPRPIITGE